MSAFDFSMIIRNVVMIMAFPVIVFGIIQKAGILRQTEKPIKIMGEIAFIMSLVVVIYTYPTFVIKGTDAIYAASHSTTSQVDKAISSWKKAKIDGEDSYTGFGAKIARVFYDLGFALSYFLRKIVLAVQKMILYTFIALSPLPIAFLAIKGTQDVSIKFFLTGFSIMLWPIGLNLADLMMYQSWALISGGITVVSTGGAVGTMTFVASTGIATGALPLTIGGALLVAVFFLFGIIFFYILGPILVTCLISGGNPVNAMMRAATSIGSVAAGMGMIEKTLSKSFGGQQVRQLKNMTQGGSNLTTNMSKMSTSSSGGAGGGGNRRNLRDMNGNNIN